MLKHNRSDISHQKGIHRFSCLYGRPGGNLRKSIAAGKCAEHLVALPGGRLHFLYHSSQIHFSPQKAGGLVLDRKSVV